MPFLCVHSAERDRPLNDSPRPDPDVAGDGLVGIVRPDPLALLPVVQERLHRRLRGRPATEAVHETHGEHANDDHEMLKKLHPIPRLVEVSEIVDALLYLESAPMVSGENIRIDGGAHAGAKW